MEGLERCFVLVVVVVIVIVIVIVIEIELFPLIASKNPKYMDSDSGSKMKKSCATSLDRYAVCSGGGYS